MILRKHQFEVRGSRTLAAVRQHRSHFFLVRLVDEFHSVEHPLHAWRLATTEVALHALGPHQLASGGHLKASLGSLVRFQLLLRHGVERPPFRSRSAFVSADS
jgi:hypothetical protein